MYRYRRSGLGWKRVLTLIILILFVAISVYFIYEMYIKIERPNEQSNQNTGTSKLSTTIKEVEENNKTVADMVESATKSVVGISKIKNIGSAIFSEDSQELGIGTGVIVSEDGHILTNWHVAGDKYSNCYVTLQSGKTYNGRVAWADTDLDLAIVKINTKTLDYITLGDSDSIRVGEAVYAIGNPIGFEFQRTVTAGIVSAKDRTIKIEEEDKVSYMEDLIQTDATINPGNSGGPLIDVKGNMIGITTIKVTTAEGIGFAIPINIVKPIIDSYKTTGDFQEAYIGIFAYDKEVIPYLNSNVEFDSGIYVAQISLDGPCYNSGLKVGDIITKIDNIEINKMSELREYIYTKKKNDEVILEILRNNRKIEIPIKLGSK